MNLTRRGTIHLIWGPMFSGKSSELLRLLRRHQITGWAYILVRPTRDTRFADATLTHSGDKIPAPRDETAQHTVCVARLADIDPRLLVNAKSIFIDEGQFFPDLVSGCDAFVRMGHTVHVAALSSDFQRKPFEVMKYLPALCKETRMLTAVCMRCGEDAEFSHRTSASVEQVDVGGADKYEALCGACYDAAAEEQK